MKRILTLAVAAALASTPILAAPQGDTTDKMSVAVGTVMGNYLKESLDNVRHLGVTVDNDTFLKTIADVLAGRDTGISVDEANEFVGTFIEGQRPAPTILSVEEQQAFIDAEAAKEGAFKTDKGVVVQVITEGEGEFPGPRDTVHVLYTGRLADGTVFDQTNGNPVSFPLNGVVAGFSDGIQHMRPGGKYRIIFPASLGYGSDGIPGVIPGNAALDFTVDLVSVDRK